MFNGVDVQTFVGVMRRNSCFLSRRLGFVDEILLIVIVR